MNPIDSDGWFGPHGTNRRTIKAERKRMNLIEQVLKIDKEATQGPWTIDPHSDGLDIEWEGGEYVARGDFRNAGYNTDDECLRHAYPNAALISLYRTAAPKLARALDGVKARISEAAKADEPPTEEDLTRWLAEIEAELR